jgi:CDP-diglyceride synthetase
VVRYLVDPKEDWVGILIAVLCAALIVAFLAPGRSGRGAR